MNELKEYYYNNHYNLILNKISYFRFNMNKIIKFLILVLLISCGNKNNDIHWKNYTTKDGLITFNYPKNWNLDLSKKLGADIYIFNNNTENINVIIQDIGSKYNLQSFTELSENQIRSIEGSILQESKEIELNGDPAGYIEYQADFKKRRELKFIQYYVLKKGKAFVITYTCEIDRFEKTKELALKIMNSFKFN